MNATHERRQVSERSRSRSLAASRGVECRRRSRARIRERVFTSAVVVGTIRSKLRSKETNLDDASNSSKHECASKRAVNLGGQC